MSAGLEDREPYPVGANAAIGRRGVLLAAAVGLATGGPRFAGAATFQSARVKAALLLC